jgi:hypothetical protein
MLDTIRPSNRLHDSSVITLTVDALRARGADPLDCDARDLDAVLPPGSRVRTRAWRPFARLLATAASMDRLGARGMLLLREMEGGPTGRRIFIDRWNRHAGSYGIVRGAAPVELREAFLRHLAADGADAETVARTRAAIRRLERAAIARGERADRLPRHERLIRRLIDAGVASEQEALRLIEASHAAHRSSAHRWIDAVTARFLTWCEGRGISVLAATPAEVDAFRAERGDALGVRTIERLLAAGRG